jgi:ABC-2 type transport system ATP-binding protein
MTDGRVYGVSDLSVSFGGRTVLNQVSLQVEPGGVVAVVGGDGAGKTTLLRVLAGAVRPSAGSVHRPPPHGIGYLPASAGVYPDLTVEENLSFVGSAYGLGARETRLRGDRLVEHLGLGEARTRLAGHLSGGMRRKLGMGMATLHEPELLILDEPTTGIDPVSRSELWSWLTRTASRATAVVFATTYLDEGERASFVLVLDDGEPLLSGTPEEVVLATPGAVFESSTRPTGEAVWRRGSGWRVWSPSGTARPGETPVRLDLEDAVVVAALAKRTPRAAA